MIQISPSAEADMKAISCEMSQFSENSGSKWLKGIRDVFDTLERHPDVGELRSEFSIRHCRSFTFGRYVIFFRQYIGGIEIARVIHGSRDLRNI
jgi:toxin ParE1/3/4